jgi:CheY-like chemotaxis protein
VRWWSEEAIHGEITTKIEARARRSRTQAADAELILRALRGGGFEVISELVQSADDFSRAVQSHCPDVVLADYNLSQWTGMEALEMLRHEGVDVPLILVSGALDDLKVVECIQQGATDVVLKNSLTRLPTSVRSALQENPNVTGRSSTSGR